MDDSPVDYIAVELYFVDGPVSTVDVKAVVAIIPNEAKAEEPLCKESLFSVVSHIITALLRQNDQNAAR